jgi:hypothetical protein
MAAFIKLPALESDRPHTSRWLLELTQGEVRDIASGGAATLRVTLPISDPEATISVRQGVN